MSPAFHNPDFEAMPREKLHELQEKRLRDIVGYAFDANPVIRGKLAAAGFGGGSEVSLDTLARLPMMDKEDLRAHYPMGLACVDAREVAEMHMSSGSTGTPICMPYTPADLAQWGECMARCYRMAGAEPGDAVQITPSFGLFNGGFGFYHGARALGLFVVPTGAGNTPRQIRVAQDFRTRILTAVVSYGIRVMEVLEEQKAALPDLHIGIFGAESFSASMKRKIAARAGHRGVRHLRHDRDRRRGHAGHGLPRPQRHPRVGGPLHRGGGGPRHAPARRGRANWANWWSPR